jgi:hypothetical protein
MAQSLRKFAEEIQNSDVTSQLGRRDTFTEDFAGAHPSAQFVGV